MRGKQDIAEVDYLLKILILGDSSVGKTCLLLRFCDDNFNMQHAPTIGIDFRSKAIRQDGKNVRVQLWDTAGQERFRTIATTLYHGVLGIVLVYSVDNRTSFQNIENWMKQIRQNVSEEVAITLVANKVDIEERQVDSSEGEYLAKQYKVPFFETSAKTGSNVGALFDRMTQTILTNIQNNPGLYKRPEVTKANQLTPARKPTAAGKGGCC